MENNTYPLQRNLIVALGEQARAAAAALQRQLQQGASPARGAPMEAIAIVTDLSTDANHNELMLDAAILAISHMSVRVSLRQKGWRLDRLGEIAVYLLVDVSDMSLPRHPADMMHTITMLVEQRLGVRATGFLLLVCPEMDDMMVRTAVVKSLAYKKAFSRGVFVLSQTNRLGLRLSDAMALSEKAAALLACLLVTPLRDAPEWLDEATASQWAEACYLQTAGISTRQWHPQQVQQRLVYCWMDQVLSIWLAENDSTAPPLPPQAGGEIVSSEPMTDERFRLVTKGVAAINPPALIRRLQRTPVQPLLTTWHWPHPFQLHRLQDALTPFLLPASWGEIATTANSDLVDEDTSAQISTSFPTPDDAWWASVALSPTQLYQHRDYLQLREELPALWQAQVQQELAHGGAGALVRVQNWLETLADLLHAHQEQIDLKLAQQAEMWVGHYARQNELQAELTTLLTAWPQDTLWAWGQAFLKPWRWPHLIWRYGQIQAAGQALTTCVVSNWQWVQMSIVYQRLLDLYKDWLTAVSNLLAQVEEVSDMLQALQRTLRDESAPLWEADHVYPDQPTLWRLLAALCPDPYAEALVAQEQIGGLSTLLTRLDEGLADDLHRIGVEQVASIHGYTAVDILRLTHPTPHHWEAWWQDMWSAATPLWRHQEATLLAEDRLQPRTLDLLLVPDANHFKERLALREDQHPQLRWLNSPDPTHIRLLRLEAGLDISWLSEPQPQRVNEAPLISAIEEGNT